MSYFAQLLRNYINLTQRGYQWRDSFTTAKHAPAWK